MKKVVCKISGLMTLLAVLLCCLVASAVHAGMVADIKDGENIEEKALKPIADDGSAMMDRRIFKERYTDDLDDLIGKRVIRVLVKVSRTDFFTVGGQPRGFEYEMIEKYKKYLKTRVRKRSWPVIFVFIPVPFDDLIPALIEGRGDIAAAGLTITAEREKKVAFTDPYFSNVKEVVVTSKDVAGIKNLLDLSGRTIFVKKGTSYVEHLHLLNKNLSAEKKKPVNIVEVAPTLSTEDILELVNAGVLDITIADNHIAGAWAAVLPNINVHGDLVVHAGGKIAWAVRKDNPDLKKSLSIVTRRNRKGSLIGNIFFQRYYQNKEWIRNPLDLDEIKRLEALKGMFKRFANQYGFDWLAIAALSYQESRLDHSLQSAAGAVGLMQVMPATAEAPPIEIPNVREIEGNIHAGVKYMAFLRDNYFNDAGILPAAKVDFSLAAYNAGPNRINRLRRVAKRAGLNPNIWFGNVEQMARRSIGRETVEYVANVNKYYIAYKLGFGLLEERERALEAIQPGSKQ
jgi:membrane-bound lytic murein transglycosylase MltF